MPRFDQHAAAQGKVKLPVKPTNSAGVPIIVEPRCHVCTHPNRHVIDQMIVAGATFSAVEKAFAGAPGPHIDRRSVAGHKEKHLGYEEAAIRAVIEREAAIAQKNHEDGVERLVTKQTYLEVALQKAYDQLINNMVEIPAGDAVKLIETLQKLQSQHHEVAIDELRVQFNAFMQAVKDVVPADMWDALRTKTHQILRSQGRDTAWQVEGEETVEEAKEKFIRGEISQQELEQIVEAEVVEEELPPTD